MISIPITYIIIGVTVVVSLLCFNNQELKYKLTFSPYSCKHHKRWYNAFTHGFVHGDYMHLFFNMFVLYSFGYQSGSVVQNGQEYVYEGGLEAEFVSSIGQMGQLWFLLLYLAGILFATIPAFYKHSDNPNYLAVGASGAVSAILFASILINPFSSIGIIFIPVGIPAIVFGPLYLGYEYFMSKRGKGNIAHDAHFAGAIFGMVFTAIFLPKTLPNLFEQIAGYFQ